MFARVRSRVKTGLALVFSYPFRSMVPGVRGLALVTDLSDPVWKTAYVSAPARAH
jgi:hypothetical protein